MISIVDQMLTVYDAKTIYDQKNAMKEVMQEIVLCGSSRAGFFNKAAFYGGTALRIFYGLDRFSEDLDFSLMESDLDFDITSYFPVLEKEVRAYGLNVKIDEHLLLFYPEDKDADSIPKNEIIKIKFEVDINPPKSATFERKFRLQPVPYEVNLYDKSSLFAGKLHAVIGRSWRNRVKGRDLYDYVFYLSRGIAVNLEHLRQRLIQSGHLETDSQLTGAILKQMLMERFQAIDFEQAKTDVEPFIRDTSSLALWSADFFCANY